jgi:hypothetical protein
MGAGNWWLFRSTELEVLETIFTWDGIENL